MCSILLSPELRRVCWHPGSVRSYDSPCYITRHVALPLERKGEGVALKPEPPLNCIMWTQWLKPAVVNTCTSCDESGCSCEDVMRECEGLSERYYVTNVTVRDIRVVPVFQKASVYLCGHRAMLLVLCSGKQNSEFEGSSQSSGSPVSAAASGFLLMTKSRLSPASIIRGTVRQQSKSLVLTRFTWKITIKEIIHHTTTLYFVKRHSLTCWEMCLLLYWWV